MRIATRSGTPARTMLRTAERRRFKSHPATFTLNTPGRLTGPQCGARQDVNLPVKVNKKGKKSTGVFMVTSRAIGIEARSPTRREAVA
jgi:hypothetical protein